MINDYINGNTKLYGLIGNPVSHTFSPFIHNTIAKKTGEENFVYLPFLVNDGGLEKAIAGAYALNIQGLNVTVPYKKDVMPYLAKIHKTAQAAGAVNTLKYAENGYEGYNTDVCGIINTFKHAHVNMENGQAVILGAGGGASAAAVAACEMGAKKIFVVNRTLNTAKQLAKHILKHYNIVIECITYDEISNIPRCSAAIQTTTVGFGNQKNISPVTDLVFFEKIGFVLDIICNPWETVFLSDAKRCGLTAVNGFDMLVYQAVASYEIWKEAHFEDSFIYDLNNELKDYLNFQSL